MHYTLLLKINFDNKEDLDVKILNKIFNDLKNLSLKNKLFENKKEKKDKVYINYNVETKK